MMQRRGLIGLRLKQISFFSRNTVRWASNALWNIVTNPFWQTAAPVAMAIFAGLLWRTSRAQNGISRRQNEISRAQNEINVATQRANVTLGRPDGVLMELATPRKGKNPTVLLYFLNSGRVVASNFFVRAIVVISGEGSVQPEGWSWDPEPMPEAGTKNFSLPIMSTIGAGAVQLQRVANPTVMARQLAEDLANGKRTILVDGKYEYDDGFGLHWTKTFSAFFDQDIRRFIAAGGRRPDRTRPTVPYPSLATNDSEKGVIASFGWEGGVILDDKGSRLSWPPETPRPPADK